MTSPTYLVRDVRVFDGVEVSHSSGHVLICDGLVASVTANIPSSLPKGTVIIDGKGRTLLPGLIDAHIHAGHDPVVLKQAASFGVTTVLDMHNDPGAVARMTSMAKSDDHSSDFRSACLAGTVKDGWPVPVIRISSLKPEEIEGIIAGLPKLESTDQAEQFVAKNIELGASYIKIMHEKGHSMNMDLPTPSLALQAAIIKAAHNRNVLAVAHCTSSLDTIQLLEIGIDGLMHVQYDVVPNDKLVAAYKNSGAFVVPTLAVIASGTGNPHSAKQIAADQRVENKLDQLSKDNMQKCMNFSIPSATFENAYNTVKSLHTAGVDIVCGSDSAPHSAGTALGVSTHHELSLYVEHAGLTPVEALRSATSVAARRFKLTDRGCVQVGLSADLILVRGDPTEDISCTLNLEKVWRRGVEVK